ncbi:hypothetical protein FQA39_LY08367 [Lamprigera yunnana]|nr:hypothetical protein FQA39_LY08367 [Lamprigera yunnana]
MFTLIKKCAEEVMYAKHNFKFGNDCNNIINKRETQNIIENKQYCRNKLLKMDPIDYLEKRIAALELEVLPLAKDVGLDKSQLIVDLLLQTHSMTTTALSCREVITSILRRMEIINDYLNPNYYDTQLEIKDKKQYILELYPEMKKSIRLVTDFENLCAFLDSSSINNIPALVDRLEKLTISNVNTYKECKEVTNKILQTLQQYNDITTSVKVLFAQLEESITNIEITLHSRGRFDD